MAYSQGGLIAATDYNNFINGSNQLNTVWATGTGNAGYGQTAISAVSQAGTVTAAQWASLINTLNSALTHQSGSGSGISATTAGSTINYLSSLSTNINTAYTNRLNASTTGTKVVGSTITPAAFTAVNQPAASTFSLSRTVTFASGDAARYFFNAGGSINFVIATATNNDGSSRSGDLVTLLNTNLSAVNGFKYNAGGTIAGSGGTVNTNSTATGYYSLTTSAQTIAQITATGTYAGDYVQLTVQSNGVQGSNADTGSILTFTLNIYSATRTDTTLGASFNDTINITVPHHVDIVPPETTNLTASWGTPTVA